MTAFYFRGVPRYMLSKFDAVRDSFDNLSNLLLLAEIVNTCAHCRVGAYVPDFDFVVFSGDFCRALVRKADGFFSMAIPFQVVDSGDSISFNFDQAGEEVSGRFISIMRNALTASRKASFSYGEVESSITDAFFLEPSEAALYCDAFVSLLSDDHGYFRFDDDAANADGHIHPRYHFDFFYKNASAVKIGADTFVDIECFYALFDGARPKRYLRS